MNFFVGQFVWLDNESLFKQTAPLPHVKKNKQTKTSLLDLLLHAHIDANVDVGVAHNVAILKLQIITGREGRVLNWLAS